MDEKEGRFMEIILKKQKVEKRQKQDPIKGLTIDELLEKDKNSYAINYADLDWISLNTSLFGSNLTFKGKKIWKIFKIIKEQYNQLAQILPTIDALKEKIEIKQ